MHSELSIAQGQVLVFSVLGISEAGLAGFLKIWKSYLSQSPFLNFTKETKYSMDMASNGFQGPRRRPWKTNGFCRVGKRKKGTPQNRTLWSFRNHCCFPLRRELGFYILKSLCGFSWENPNPCPGGSLMSSGRSALLRLVGRVGC